MARSFSKAPPCSWQVQQAYKNDDPDAQVEQAKRLSFASKLLDLLRQQRRFTKSLRMTKHEIREEFKETDGNQPLRKREPSSSKTLIDPLQARWYLHSSSDEIARGRAGER